MTRKRKSMAGMGKGVDAFFEEPEEQQVDKAVSQQADKQTKRQVEAELERATFYIWPSQQTTLEELKLKLRKQKVKTNKSELVREALDLLAEQKLEVLADRLTNK